MKAPARLGLYAAGLAAVFAVAFVTAGAVIDEDTVQAWVEQTPEDHHADDQGDGRDGGGSEGDGAANLFGLGLAQDGYRLTDVSAPDQIGIEGAVTLTVIGPDREPVTGFEVDHEQEMHLIAVRSDGQYFRHVHPERDGSGTWALPWEWEAAGTYRIFADFVPAQTGAGMTLSTTVQVAGDFAPAPADQPVTETTVGDFEVTVQGDLIAGEASELTMAVSRDGEPVRELEPYLGAFGHLVALRDGDLAYLHVHPRGDAPAAGETSGPEILFEATAPTPGRYLLFLDFQVDGQVHTAPLVVDTTAAAGRDTGDTGPAREGEGEDHDH